MKIKDLDHYKALVNHIKKLETDINFLTALKNSECGKRIREFCSHDITYGYVDFEPTEKYKKYVWADRDNMAIHISTPNGKTFYCRRDANNDRVLDRDIEYIKEVLPARIKEKEDLERCTLDVSEEDAREFYNVLLDRYQRDDDSVVSFRTIDGFLDGSDESYLRMEACVHYGISEGRCDGEVVVKGRQLYIIDGEVYRASQREIEAYCKATGKAARKVEPKHLKEVE